MRIYSDRFHVGGPTQVGPITLFPVWSETRPNVDYIAGPYLSLQVEELEQPQVGTLHLANPTGATMLVPEGTILAGGNQTRVLQHDVLMGAQSDSAVDVRCVEQGRWGARVAAGVAGRVPTAVMASLRGIGRPDMQRGRADQGDVWQRVNMYEQVYGVRRTSSLNSILLMEDGDRIPEPDKARRERLHVRERFARALAGKLVELASRPLPGQNGIMIGMSGQPVLLEIFHDEAAFRAQFAAIVQAAAFDAPRATGEPTPARRAVRMADAIMDSTLDNDGDTGRLVGMGERVDIRTLTTRGQALHTAALNTRHALLMA